MNPVYHYEKAYLQIKGMPCEWQLYLKPKPYAVSRMPGKGWRPGEPDFRILQPADQPDLSMELFRSDIPANFITIVEPFTSHQWMLLRLLYEGAACLELALSNPVLAYAVANNTEFRTKPEDRISILGKLCLKKQKELLEWLGFPCSPATVRLFQKIIPEAANPSILRMFRTALKDTEFSKALGHLRQINAGVLALVTNCHISDAVTPKLLVEVSETPGERIASPAADLLFETCAMIETIQTRRQIRQPIFETIAGLQAAHDELIPQYNAALLPPTPPPPGKRTRPTAADDQFGKPPIPGTDDIEPITSASELEAEGSLMQHCVAIYAHLIRKGKMYVYRVERPGRATLSVIPGTYGRWQLADLKGPCNAKVTVNTLQAVKKWIEQAATQQLQKAASPLVRICYCLQIQSLAQLNFSRLPVKTK